MPKIAAGTISIHAPHRASLFCYHEMNRPGKDRSFCHFFGRIQVSEHCQGTRTVSVILTGIHKQGWSACSMGYPKPFFCQLPDGSA
jgi:hypothetical protein